MLKGKTIIELTDVHTGKKEYHEHDNMVTNVVKNELGVSKGIFPASLGFNFLSDSTGSIATRLFGGLYLYDNPLSSDPDDYILPGNSHPVGYGAIGTVNEGINTMLGSYSDAESGLQEDGSYKHVWNFSTEQANGSISAVALTNKLAGLLGPGITDLDLLDMSSYSQLSGEYYDINGKQYLKIPNDCIPIYIDDNYIYSIERDNLLIYSATNASLNLKNNGKKLIIKRYSSRISNIRLNDNYYTASYIDEYTIQLPDEFDISGISNVSRQPGVFLYKGENIYIAYKVGNTNLSLCRVNILDASTSMVHLTFDSQLPSLTWSYDSGIIENYQPVIICGNYIVVMNNSNAIIQAVNLSNQDDRFTLSLPQLSTGDTIGSMMQTYGDNLIYGEYKNGSRKDYIINIGTKEVGILSKYYLLPILCNPQINYANKYGTAIQHDDIYYAAQNSQKLIIRLQPVHFLSTKNNLEATVIKTSSQSMKVTYILTQS